MQNQPLDIYALVGCATARPVTGEYSDPHTIEIVTDHFSESDLQQIADSFPGVERSFAVQAGREVRILVRPEEIDDLASMRLARDIVRKIEESLTYPGQIKVTVIRETRAVEYAK